MLHRKVEVGPVPVKSNMAVPLVKTVTPSLMKLTIHKRGGPAKNYRIGFTCLME